MMLGVAKPKKNKVKKALRFEIELKINDSDEYTTVDFPKLVQNMVSDLKESKKDPKNDSLMFDGDEHEISEMAAYFEEKYNRAQVFKYDINKGEGYVQDDSFIDDSEAYDEIIPPGIETAHGGFYINCGKLELIEVPEPEDAARLEREAEREHAALLQQLKRKRKADDLDVDAPKIKKVSKPKPKAPKVEQSLPSKADQPPPPKADKPLPPKVDKPLPPKADKSLPSKVDQLPPSPKVDQPLPVPATPPGTSVIKNGNPIIEDDDDDVQLIGEKIAPVDRKEESILKQQKKQAKIPQELANGISKKETVSPEKLSKLKTTLLIHKVPYEVINKIPKTKGVQQANGLLPNEWSVFLIDLYKNTAQNPELRRKIFDALAEYLSIGVTILLNYASKIIEQLAEAQKSAKSSKSSSSLLASNKGPKVSSNNSTNVSKGQSLINQQSAEGLASKLQSDRSAVKPIYPSSSSKAPTNTAAQFQAIYNAIRQKQAVGDKKGAQALLSTLLALQTNAIQSSGASTGRPSASNSPLAPNSLLQPQQNTSKPSKSVTQKQAQPNQATVNNLAKLFSSTYSQEELKVMQEYMKTAQAQGQDLSSAFGQPFNNPLVQMAGRQEKPASSKTAAPHTAGALNFNQKPKQK